MKHWNTINTIGIIACAIGIAALIGVLLWNIGIIKF